MITVVQTALNGLVVLKPRIFEDARGYFFESFSKRDLEELVGPVDFVQDNALGEEFLTLRSISDAAPPLSESILPLS